MRRLVLVGLLVGAIVGLGSTSNAQFRQRIVSPLVEPQVTPEIDRGVQQSLNDAKSLLDQRQFNLAVARLQSVLDFTEDYFVDKDFRSTSSPHNSVRSQTLQILADLTPEGRAAYEAYTGVEAKDLLKQATSKNDLNQISLVASKFQMTAAGFEAMQILAAHAFDHDQPLEAALRSDALLAHPRADGPLRPSLILQSAFAWYLAGDLDRSFSALQSLSDEKNPWLLGGREIDPIRKAGDPLAWLQLHFGPTVPARPATVTSWALPRGGSTGNESATDTCPIGGGVWFHSPREHLRLHSDPEINRQRIEAFDQLTQIVERTLRDNHRLCHLAAVPLIVGDIVVYRTLNDVTAVSLKTGQLLWQSATTDGMLTWLFQSAQATSESVPASSLLTFRGYLRFKLFRDQLSGSLSSDGKNVYSIEESESQFSPLLPRNRMPFGAQMILDPTNKLAAYELSGGRLLWEVGGQSGTPPVDLSGVFFLGPPLPYEGRLYCLAEEKNELRLLCLVPEAKSARLEWSQALVNTGQGVFVAPRRLAGLVPSISDGIAVCPTADGSIVAYDLVQRQLRWGHSYDSQTRRIMQGGTDFLSEEEEGRWLDSNPILANGRVVITPRDSIELTCLSLVDGSLLWSRPREQGLYVAGITDEAVVVVGRTHVTAYSVKDGTEAWKEPLEIPEPSGRGVRIASKYLLPLSNGEIATLDLTTGRILGRSKLQAGRIPGNLAVGGAALVSSGINDVIGFRPLADVEQQVATQLKSNQVDPEALALRGELRLHRGQEEEAIEDMRQSLRQQSNSKVKRILAETLLNRLKHDTNGILKSAAELESLTEDPRQRIEFRRLYAEALSKSDDPVGASVELVRLVLTSAIPDEMIAVGPTHSISLEQSIRSQLFKIYENASLDQRAAISMALGKEVEFFLSASDRNLQLARFIKLVAGHPAADRSLLRLAESNDVALDEPARIKLLERLAQSNSKPISAMAVASVAARLLSTKAPQDAVPWIDELKYHYSQEVCRDGKTGRQLSDEWLDRPDIRATKNNVTWPLGKVEIQRTEESTLKAALPVQVVTRVGHYFDGWTFETDPQVTTLTARDPSLRVAWKVVLINSLDEVRGQPTQLHIRGRRLAISAGMWMGVMESTDTRTAPRMLFDRSLRPNSLSIARMVEPAVERRLLPTGRRFQLMWDARGTAGFLVGLSDDAVFYQLDNRLYAADSETGRILWSWTGQQFAKADATVDKYLVINSSSNGAMLLRTLDGTVYQRHQGNPNDVPVWFRGTHRLSHRMMGAEQRMLEMRDFDGDRVVWQSLHPAGTVSSVIENDELAVFELHGKTNFERTGKLKILNLMTSEQRFVTDLEFNPTQDGFGVLAVQRLADRYITVAGVWPKNPNNFGAPRDFKSIGEISAATNGQFVVDGVVSSIGRADGKLHWSVKVTNLAFDTTQPVSLPVLVLASWQNETDRIQGLLLSPRLSVMVIDKRTGEKVYDKQEAIQPIGRGIQLHPIFDERKLVIDFYNWQLNLKFTAK